MNCETVPLHYGCKEDYWQPSGTPISRTKAVLCVCLCAPVLGFAVGLMFRSHAARPDAETSLRAIASVRPHRLAPAVPQRGLRPSDADNADPIAFDESARNALELGRGGHRPRGFLTPGSFAVAPAPRGTTASAWELVPFQLIGVASVCTGLYALVKLYLRGRRDGVSPEPAAWAMASVEADPGWAGFVGAVSGEWEGFYVEFDKAGAVQQLPDYAVPEAMKEWGVECFDYQTQTCADGDAEGVKYTQSRFYPTAGCEVDATTVFDRKTVTLQPSDPGLMYYSDGSFTAGPEALPADEPYELQLCLVDAGERRRIRLLLKMHGTDLRGGGLIMEWWEAEYSKNASLPTSCGGTRSYLSGMSKGPEGLGPQSLSLPGGVGCLVQPTEGGGLAVQVEWETGDGQVALANRDWAPSAPQTD